MSSHEENREGHKGDEPGEVDVDYDLQYMRELLGPYLENDSSLERIANMIWSYGRPFSHDIDESQQQLYDNCSHIYKMLGADTEDEVLEKLRLKEEQAEKQIKNTPHDVPKKPKGEYDDYIID